MQIGNSFHFLTFSADMLNRFFILCIGHKLTVEQINVMGCIVEHARIVGGNDDRFASFTELFEQLHDHDAALSIEVAGRLIGQDQWRVIDQGTRYCHTLLLTTRKLR